MNITSGKALVTGGTGFIGSNVARRLLSEGWKVDLLCRKGANFSLIEDLIHQVSIHEHDGKTDTMLTIFEHVHPDIVFHLASLSPSVHRPNDIVPMIQSNIVFGTQLVEAMVQNSCYDLIHAGTLLQHFEGKPYSPVCLYAATKQAFVNILQYYLETTPLKVIQLTLSNIFGKGDPRPRIFPLLKKASEQQTPLAMSPGEQFIDLVYIDDAVEAFILAALRLKEEHKQNWEEYVVSSQKPIRLKELVKLYEEVTGRMIPIVWGGVPYRPREMMIYQSYGNPLPGWSVKTGIAEGIKKMNG